MLIYVDMNHSVARSTTRMFQTQRYTAALYRRLSWHLKCSADLASRADNGIKTATVIGRGLEGTCGLVQPADISARRRQCPGFASRNTLLRNVVDRLLLVPALQVVVYEPSCAPYNRSLCKLQMVWE